LSPKDHYKPKQHEPAERPKWLVPAAGVLAVLILAGGVWAFISNRSGKGRQELPVAATLTATDLATEFSKDAPGANKKYGNNLLVVTGKIGAIPRGKLPLLTFETPAQAKWTLECLFNVPDDLKDLSAGQEVTVLGECEAMPQRGKLKIQLTSCKVVERR
jgi:hypothetical protein